MLCTRITRSAASLIALILAGVTTSANAQHVVRVEGARNVTFNGFDEPFVFAYGSFDKRATVADGVARITADNGKGGAGHTLARKVIGLADECPVLIVKLGPANQAGRLRLICDDPDKNQRAFEYDLSQANRESFTALYPAHALPLNPSAIGEADNPFDPTRIATHHLQGDWQDTKVDVAVERIELRKPQPGAEALRAAYRAELDEQRARDQRKAQELAEQRARQLANAEHMPEGPQVVEVGAVDRDVIAIRIQERQIVRRGQVPYEPQPDDIIKQDEKSDVLAWIDGKPGGQAAIDPKSRAVQRKVPNRDRPQTVGTLLVDGRTLTLEDEARGDEITSLTIDQIEAYRVRSSEDPAYVTPCRPESVAVKAKPAGVERELIIYLALPEPMREGAIYTIDFKGVNTAEPTTSFTFDSRALRSPAIQTSHVGYRPDDPFKRAFLSQWKGTGGPHDYADFDRFELIDEQQGVAYEGAIVKILDAAEKENLHGQNRTKTHVYAMDFGGFTEPGTYRVHVPGLGVSYRFQIADGVWEQAFQHAMKGYLSHRSGIELPASLMGYDRPRPMHPDDGFIVLQTDVTVWAGESEAIRDSLTRLLGKDLDAGKLERVSNAWGGYMDAGDWDRRSQHLEATYRLLELVRLFPERMSRIELTLPEAEANNRIPDALDEAIWNVSFFERLQTPDGGIRGGIESTAHPRSGETSWQESLLVAAFMPDPVSSYRFAASAALLAHLLEPYDAERAAELTAAAQRAYDWAGANAERVIAEAEAQGFKRGNADARRDEVRNARALAAVELLRRTGNRRYHDDFAEATSLGKPGEKESQMDAHFAYATLTESLRDAKLAEQARQQVTDKANEAMQFAEGNAYGLSHHVPNLPMMGWVAYYSVPESLLGPTLPRAHYLTGDTKYLAGALRAAHYGVGANPMNMTMTTGLGHAAPRFPLHVDSRTSGQPAPDGITVYGPHDPTRAPGWVKQWHLRNRLVPDAEHWPAAEWYIDLSSWAEMTEYTIHQTIGPVAYYWGYLAARP